MGDVETSAINQNHANRANIQGIPSPQARKGRADQPYSHDKLKEREARVAHLK